MMVDKAKAEGVSIGIHTLSNFMTTNDSYVTPIPSKNLLKQGILTLNEDLDSTQTEIKVKKSHLFSRPMTLNAIQIENELVTYKTTKEYEDITILHGCKRGAFGTISAKHKKNTNLSKFGNNPNKTIFPT